MKKINIEGLLHIVRMYRENEIYKCSSNGFISLEERAKMDKNLQEQGRFIDLAIMKFKDPNCKECANYRTCLMPKNPHITCFEIEYGE